MTLSTADLALARRFEAAEAANGFAFAAASGGAYEAAAMAGGCALYAGTGSPVTHALGIGMNGAVAAAELDRLEEFFRTRSSPCLIDLCPLADPGLMAMIFERGYRVIELNNLMVRPVEAADTAGREEAVRAVAEEEFPAWCQTVIRAFSEPAEPTAEMIAMAESLPFIGESFFAEADGRHAATAAMRLHDGVAALYGDATLGFARGRGLQQALIRHRVALAAERRADWAMACVVPGTASHRNYERCGFRLFYMRVNVSRETR